MDFLKAIEGNNMDPDTKIYNIIIHGMCRASEVEATRDLFVRFS